MSIYLKSVRLAIDLASIQMFGVATDINETQMITDYRPILVQSVDSIRLDQQKFLHIEYETNPLEKHSENRIQIISESLQIIYDAVLFIEFNLAKFIPIVFLFE